MIKVLFTGGGGAGSEAMVRLWSDKYEVHLADADAQAMPPSIPEHRRHTISLAGSAWAASVASICKKMGINFLIPTVDEELPFTTALNELLPNTSIIVPTQSFVSMMRDKLEFARCLKKAHIDTPHTQTINHINEIGFPCFAKPRFGRGSRGIQILQCMDEANAYSLLSHQASDQLLAQEYLEGQEWTVYAAANQKQILQNVIPVRVDKKRGITLRAETAEHLGIINLVERIHHSFPTEGCYNIQLIECKDGRLAVFEINPRVSTTLCLAISAGADPINDYLNTDLEQKKLRPFKSGIKLQRNWFNHIT